MNFNLFIPMNRQPDEQDVQLLANCNHISRGWRHSKLFYALKNQILFNFGIRDGYDLQYWHDEDYNYDGEIFATHNHILERYILCGRVFHKPTNEFYYYQWDHSYNDKISPRYKELSEQIKEKIKGKKDYCFNAEALELAWKSLKPLVKKYRYLLRWKYLHEHPMYLRAR